MKTFKKVLASALAAAMVVTAFPVANAEAATAPKLSATKATLYVGQSKTITVKNVAKGSKVTATSSNKKAATVSVKGTKVTVKSVKKGTATVNVKVTPKKGAAKKLTAKITVKTPTVKFTDSVTEAKIATPVKVKATATPAVSVKYYSADKSIATVGLTSGTVTGKKEGTVKVAAVIKTGTKTTKVYKEIAVVNAITAKAVATTKIDVTFAGEIEKADKANFTVTDNKGATALIKSATLDTTKKVVTLEFYSSLTSGNSYKVVAKNGEKTYEATVDYVKGTVAKIEVANQVVKATSKSAIAYKVLDENGLDITADTHVTFQGTVPCSDGYVTLTDKVVAYITVIYTNPTTGAQIKSEQFTITGAKEVAAKVDAVTVSSATITTAAAWPKEVSTTVVNDNTLTQILSVKTTDTFGATTYVSTGAVSANPEILIVDAKTGKLTPVKEGTATVNVKQGDVTNSFTLTVVAKSKKTSLAVDTASKTTTSLTENSGAKTNANVIINVMDQNSKKMSATDAIEMKLTDGAGIVSAGGAALAVDDVVNGTAGTGIALEPVKAGTAWFVVSDKTDSSVPSIYIAVTVTAADQKIAGYKFAGVPTKFDLNGDNTTPAGTTQAAIAISAVNAAGEKVTNATPDTVSGVAITLKDAAGNTLINATTDNTGAIANKLDVTDTLKNEGTYTLTATKNGVVYDSVTITVVDTSTKPSVSVKTQLFKAAGSSVALTDLFDVKDAGTTPTVNVIYTSSNTGVVTACANTTTGVSAVALGADTGSATLYGVKVLVTVGNRTYTVDLSSTPITITK